MTDYGQMSRVAQDGFTRLLQEVMDTGATEQEALTIILSMAQLQAQLAGVTIENTSLPGEALSLN